VLSSGGALTATCVLAPTREHDPRALSPFDAQRVVQQLCWDADRTALLSLYDLATGAEAHTPAGMQSSHVVAVIESAARSGRIVFTKGWDFGDLQGLVGRDHALSPAAALARTIMSSHMGVRDELAFEGQRYRLVDADITSSAHGGDDFHPVAASEAPALLKRMADSLSTTAEQRARWAEALAFATEPAKGRGIRLLRHIPARYTQSIELAAPAPPPRARAPAAPEHWIEVEIVYEYGTPFMGNCVLTLPGGKVTEGPPGEGGLLCMDGLTAGTCKLRFPELDAGAFQPA